MTNTLKRCPKCTISKPLDEWPKKGSWCKRCYCDYAKQHPPSKTKVTWVSMLSRCENPNDRRYADWGGRGIAVCERWHTFALFVEDMGEKPDGLTLDRIDNDKGYCKENCKWSTQCEQSNNRRTNRWIEHDGKRLTLAQWSRITGIKPNTLKRRLDVGYSVSDALTPL